MSIIDTLTGMWRKYMNGTDSDEMKNELDNI